MAKRPGKSIYKRQLSDGLIPTAILTVCFLVSALAGCMTVSLSGDSSAASMSSFLHSYLALTVDGKEAWPSFGAVLWEFSGWPLLILLLGFSALGALFIPVVFCMRGFLLSYTIAAFTYVFGAAGLLAAAAVFGLNALVSVPVLFAVGTVTFPSSLRLAKGVFGERLDGPGYRERYICLLPCTALLALAAAVQWSAVPQLLYAAAKLLSAL